MPQQQPDPQATHIVVVIGPSASGKSSLVRALAARGLVRVRPTYTTRPRRPDEVAGSVEHRFVSDDRFDRLERDGFFLDTEALFGLPFRYGLPARPAPGALSVELVMLRAPLVARFAARVADPLVYAVEADCSEAAARLRPRGCPPGEIEARLADNDREVLAGRVIADRVFVNDGTLDTLMTRVAAALTVDFGVLAEAS